MQNRVSELSVKQKWSIPKIFSIVVEETEGKPVVRLFEGGDRPFNPCNPASANYNPSLPRCINRGPS